jgi:hypothetical protein
LHHYLGLTKAKIEVMYKLTLRFDDAAHSLTAENGLPIGETGELLQALAKALNVDDNNKVTLSEIRGNCYALELATPVVTMYETIKVLHEKIDGNEFEGLNRDQRNYAGRLKNIMERHQTDLRVYDESKVFNLHVENIKLPKEPQHYFQKGSIYGVVTAIGGVSLSGKSTIHVSEISYDIEIDNSQEVQLLQYFKKNRLYFDIRKKINFQTGAVQSAELQDFEVVGTTPLIEAMDDLKSKYPDGVFNNLDGVEAVRDIRGFTL